MDYRSRKQKLEAMANQSASPHEAEIAKKKLEELKDDEVEYRLPFTFYFNEMPIFSYSFTASYAPSMFKPSGIKDDT